MQECIHRGKATILPLRGGKNDNQLFAIIKAIQKDDERSSSYKEHKVNALVPRAEEGRDKLR